MKQVISSCTHIKHSLITYFSLQQEGIPQMEFLQHWIKSSFINTLVPVACH